MANANAPSNVLGQGECFVGEGGRCGSGLANAGCGYTRTGYKSGALVGPVFGLAVVGLLGNIAFVKISLLGGLRL